MEQNDINEDQIEPIISDLASYCYKHNLSFDVFIQSGYKALLLEKKFRVSVERYQNLFHDLNKYWIT
jgi:hypothetical protein